MNLTESLPLIRLAAESLDNTDSPTKILDLVSQGNPFDEMFFGSLSDARWISLLTKAGFFADLPAPISDSAGSTRFPRSLPLSGLTRLAPSAPSEVIEILESLPETDNPQVDDQIMRCIAQINDPTLTPRILSVIKHLLGKPVQHEWIWIEEILRTWTKLGITSEVIELLGLYLYSQIRRQEDRYGAGTGWQSAEIDRDFIEPLSASHRLELGHMLFGVLQFWKLRQKELIAADPNAIEKAFVDSEEVDDREPPTYWLEDFKSRTSRSFELEEILATRLYEIGTSLFADGDKRSMNEFDTILRSDSWELFARLRWQLYAEYPEQTLEWARTDILQRIPALGHYEGEHGYEMAQMLEAHSLKHGASFLNPSEVEQALASIMDGPIDHYGDRDTDERFVPRFYRKQLHPLRTLLAGKALDTYRELSKEKPDLCFSNYKPYSTGGEGRNIEHVAPEKAESMTQMGQDELWEFLNTWKPEGNRIDSDKWWVEESVSALGTKFAEMLEASPERFQASDRWWRKLTRPVILYKPLENATARISSESKENPGQLPSDNEWLNWFGLASWIADWGGEPPKEEIAEPARPEDRDWNWPRIIAVKFLAAAINPRFSIPECLKPEVGRLLSKFVEDPDSRLALKDKPMLEDWLTTAINSVRGTALETLLYLALHQRKHNVSQQPEEWIWQAVRRVLTAEEQSPAVFAIMGARLHLALYLYAEHFKREPGLLMPEGRIRYGQAFVLSQVRYGNALGDLLKIFPNFSITALDCLTELNTKELAHRDQQRGNFGGRLGTHLAFYYWNDDYPSMVAGEQIMNRYFEIADSSQRARAIRDIARIFADAKPEENHEQLYGRVCELWDRRFRAIETNRANGTYAAEEVHEELSSFVQWLGCECFSFEWRHSRVLRAISLSKNAPLPAFTMRTLELLSREPEKLGACTEILEALLSKETRIVAWAYQEDEMRSILVRGLKSPDTAIQERTRQIQETLLRNGLFEYLSLEAKSAESN